MKTGKSLKSAIAALIAMLLVGGYTTDCSAIDINVYAYENSLMNNPLDTGINLDTGDLLSVRVDFNQIWSAGDNNPIAFLFHLCKIYVIPIRFQTLVFFVFYTYKYQNQISFFDSELVL